jgi:hypothetical protein
MKFHAAALFVIANLQTIIRTKAVPLLRRA